MLLTYLCEFVMSSLQKNNLSYLTIISSQNGSLLSINCQKHVVCCMLVCYEMDTFFIKAVLSVLSDSTWDTFVAAADCWKQYREYCFYKESGLTFFYGTYN